MENSRRKLSNLMIIENSKAPTHQTMGNTFHIPVLVKAFPYLENGGLNLLLNVAKSLTCITVS